MNIKIKKHMKMKLKSLEQEDLDHHHSIRGIYMRDDHCDWGSSGMNDLIETSNDNN